MSAGPSYVLDLSSAACAEECCGPPPVPCPDCDLPESFTAVLSATGDLAFLDGAEVVVVYIGETGGSPSLYQWSGSTTVDGWTATVSWGVENNTLCNIIYGNITLFKTGECSNTIQEMGDPATTTSIDCSYTGTVPEATAFIITSQQIYNNGEPFEGQCFTGTVGAVALPTP